MFHFITNKKHNLIKIRLIAVTIIFIWVIANCTAIAVTYYVDPEHGNDGNPGTGSGSWKTISHAKEQAKAGDIVYLRPGNYGSVTFDSDDSGNVTGYITYKGDPDTISEIRPADWWSKTFNKSSSSKRPVFYGITIGSSAQYLRFEDIDFVHTGPDDAETAPFRCSGGAHHIQCKNLNIFGYHATYINQSTGSAFTFGYGDFHDILIEDCYAENIGTFVNIDDTATTSGNTRTSFLIKGNHSYNHYLSGVKINKNYNSTGLITIENNHIWKSVCKYWQSGSQSHNSGISIRRHHVHIKNNIIHSGWSTRSIRTYQVVFDGEKGRPDTGYQDIIIENNLIYDQEYYVELLDVGSNVTIANNTIVGKHLSNSSVDGYFYYAMMLNTNPNVKYDLATINIYNNIFVGRLNARHFRSRCSNNIIYYGVNSADLKEHNIVYRPNTGQGHYYGPEIFSVSGNFFVGSEDFTFDERHGLNLNEAFKLVENAAAIGYADPAFAPSKDLLDNSRVGVPEAGCYEYLENSQSQQSIPPGPPTNLVVESVSKTEITLSWHPANEDELNIDYYNIYRNDAYLAKCNTAGYTDNDVSPATNYQYKISAVSREGLESGFAASVQIQTPPAESAPEEETPPQNNNSDNEQSSNTISAAEQAKIVKAMYKKWFHENQKYLSTWSKQNRWHLVMNRLYEESVEESPLEIEQVEATRKLEHQIKATMKKSYMEWYNQQRKNMYDWMKVKRQELVKSKFQDPSILNENLSSVMHEQLDSFQYVLVEQQPEILPTEGGYE
ncbi:MAG: fibronectin type III domain-containing protein [Sedimentisphaerales bacterium]|nr:fibronectin type III domain-containing protein [Sedimentisphaerales bacterium]